LLTSAGKTWADVVGNKAGAVEAAVMRNAYAHGTRVLSQGSVNRLGAVGLSGAVGASVTLRYEDLMTYRSRLLSLLNVGGFGKNA
jgi:hypothetical protein